MEFQNMSILLNNFKTWTFCYIVFKLSVNTHFFLVTVVIVLLQHTNGTFCDKLGTKSFEFGVTKEELVSFMHKLKYSSVNYIMLF